LKDIVACKQARLWAVLAAALKAGRGSKVRRQRHARSHVNECLCETGNYAFT
jgi:hypothetical protein